eukprot:COSAG01_NODE_21561_length_896_cov_1.328733_1_plen_194_part_00
MIPRELRVKQGFLHISPIEEIFTLRHHEQHWQLARSPERLLLTNSSQVELRLNCTLPRSPPQPSLRLNFSLDVLATPNQQQWARYGYNLGARQFFVASRGMLTTESKPQKPYVDPPASVSLTVLVDGGVVESFTDSSTDMSASPKRVPWPNGAVTTRSFLPAGAPYELQGRGAYLSPLPSGVACSLSVAELAL